MEKLPSSVISEEILSRLEVETLCAVACVDRALRVSVESLILPSLFLNNSLDPLSLSHILRRRCNSIQTLSLNCLRFSDSSLTPFLSPQIQHLHLSSCSLLSSQFLASIAQNCPSLRVLTLELADQHSPTLFASSLAFLLTACQHLECLSLKIRGMQVDANSFQAIELFLPQTITTLKLKPFHEENAIHMVNKLGVGENHYTAHDLGISLLAPSGFALHCLSLVLDVISDRLLKTIANCLPLLVELELEDRPNKEPSPHLDLTNSGLQSLHSCHHLIDLSLIRSRQNCNTSFRRVNDMGVFLLSESCKGLQSVRLCGFNKVSDAGYASLLHSCHKLQRFEVRNALFLSDLAFHDLMRAPCNLVEVRLLSCSTITSETVKRLGTSSNLEVIDLFGCKSVADSCLSSIARLQKLTTLNLAGADITDRALSVLGQGSTPLIHLCLRGCKRVTDKGISYLLCGDGNIGQTLSVLDLGYMPGISDNSILTIAAAGREITELSIRCCFYVTNYSLQALATKRRIEDGSKAIRQLDLFNCIGLSADALELFRRPLFQGLHWVGVGQTRLAKKRDAVISEIYEERPWLTVCLEGCEMGCLDGWPYHRPAQQ